MEKAILVINAGSSSIKFAIFAISKDAKKIYSGMVDRITTIPELIVYDTEKNRLCRAASVMF